MDEFLFKQHLKDCAIIQESTTCFEVFLNSAAEKLVVTPEFFIDDDEFDDFSNSSVFIRWVYWVFTVPITMVLFVLWCFWEQHVKLLLEKRDAAIHDIETQNLRLRRQILAQPLSGF